LRQPGGWRTARILRLLRRSFVRTAGAGVSRAVRPSRSPTLMTCLAPDIVEAILHGSQPKGLRVAEMLGPAVLTWNEQRVNSGFGSLPTECALVMSDRGALGALRTGPRAGPTARTEAIRSATVAPANETNGSGPAIF
jgi:hypothetical protein